MTNIPKLSREFAYVCVHVYAVHGYLCVEPGNNLECHSCGTACLLFCLFVLKQALSLAGAPKAGLVAGHRAPGLWVSPHLLLWDYKSTPPCMDFIFFMSEEEAQNPKIALIISTLGKWMFTASSPPKTRSSQATVQIHVWTIKTKKEEKVL